MTSTTIVHKFKSVYGSYEDSTITLEFDKEELESRQSKSVHLIIESYPYTSVDYVFNFCSYSDIEVFLDQLQEDIDSEILMGNLIATLASVSHEGLMSPFPLSVVLGEDSLSVTLRRDPILYLHYKLHTYEDLDNLLRKSIVQHSFTKNTIDFYKGHFVLNIKSGATDDIVLLKYKHDPYKVMKFTPVPRFRSVENFASSLEKEKVISEKDIFSLVSESIVCTSLPDDLVGHFHESQFSFIPYELSFETFFDVKYLSLIYEKTIHGRVERNKINILCSRSPTEIFSCIKNTLIQLQQQTEQNILSLPKEYHGVYYTIMKVYLKEKDYILLHGDKPGYNPFNNIDMAIEIYKNIQKIDNHIAEFISILKQTGHFKEPVTFDLLSGVPQENQYIVPIVI